MRATTHFQIQQHIKKSIWPHTLPLFSWEGGTGKGKGVWTLSKMLAHVLNLDEGYTDVDLINIFQLFWMPEYEQKKYNN